MLLEVAYLECSRNKRVKLLGSEGLVPSVQSSRALSPRVCVFTGPLWLHDPRGPRPPFGNFHSVAPAVGSAVLFPSWLVHEVRPSLSPRAASVEVPTPVSGSVKGGADQPAAARRGEEAVEHRVSFSCNVPGSWDDSADLSVSFPA